MNTYFGYKKGQSQAFDEAGQRVPVTFVHMPPTMVVGQRTMEKNGYTSWQIALGSKKNLTKPMLGLFKNLQEKISPQHIREIEITDQDTKNVGEKISVDEVFTAGDIINVSGVSVGKGFAGVVKRWGFHGSPETHGTSNRQRHAGSIGQTTTPGRVYKGKKMAGHMGSEMITVRNLRVFAVKPEENVLVIRGLVPGKPAGLLKITKVPAKAKK